MTLATGLATIFGLLSDILSCAMPQDLGSDASSTGTLAKSKTGPKASLVWTDCFLKTGRVKCGRTPHKCKFCNWSCEGRVGDAEEHIANICTKVPEHFQLAAQNRIANITMHISVVIDQSWP